MWVNYFINTATLSRTPLYMLPGQENADLKMSVPKKVLTRAQKNSSKLTENSLGSLKIVEDYGRTLCLDSAHHGSLKT